MVRHTVALTTSAHDMAETIKARLEELGFDVLEFRPAREFSKINGRTFDIPWHDWDAAAHGISASLAGLSSPLGGWINLIPATSGVAFETSAEAAENCVAASLVFAQLFVPHLRAADSATRRVLNVTALDGRCGLHQRPVGMAGSGTLGLFKTLQLEFPELRVTSLDFDGSGDEHAEEIVIRHWVADRVLAEYFSSAAAIEVGYDRHGRWRPTLIKLESSPDLPRPLCEDVTEPVILIAGGAAGVTGAVAESIVAGCRPHLILVGRTSLAEIEMADATVRPISEIRKSLIDERRRRQEPVIPAEIERELLRTMRLSEMKQRIERLRSSARSVEYHAVDLQDETAFGGLLDDIQTRFGGLTGVIHGAGVIEDRRLMDKTLSSFQRVFRTKIRPAHVIRDKFAPGSLKFVVFFASVSGRFGSIGQVDYAAANEHLGKLAQQLRHDWTQTRVISVGWGPWNGGMVREDLQRLYAARGIGLIPLDTGGPALIQQLNHQTLPTAETLIVADLAGLITAGNRFEETAEAMHARG